MITNPAMALVRRSDLPLVTTTKSATKTTEARMQATAPTTYHHLTGSWWNRITVRRSGMATDSAMTPEMRTSRT